MMLWSRPAVAVASNGHNTYSLLGLRAFTATAATLKIKLPPRPKPPPDEEFTEVYLKGSGPGGQKIVGPNPLHTIIAKG